MPICTAAALPLTKHLLSPAASTHHGLQAIQWKCNHPRLPNSVLKVTWCPGQPGSCSHSPHTWCSAQRDHRNSLASTHACTLLACFHRAISLSQDPAPVCAPAPDGFQVGWGEQPPTSSSAGHPATSTAAAWGLLVNLPGAALPATLTRPFPSKTTLHRGSVANPQASTELESPNETLPALLLGLLHQGDSAVAQDLEQISRRSSHISTSKTLFCAAFLCFHGLSWLSLQSEQRLQLVLKCWS